LLLSDKHLYSLSLLGKQTNNIDEIILHLEGVTKYLTVQMVSSF